jgi:Secretion system C-terminal sorting domain
LNLVWNKYLEAGIDSCFRINQIVPSDFETGIFVQGNHFDLQNLNTNPFLFFIGRFSNALHLNNNESIHFRNRFEIYPNPISDYFKVNDIENSNFEVSIFDIFGRKILMSNNNNTSIISTKHLLNGNYVVLVSAKNDHQYLKIIIEH